MSKDFYAKWITPFAGIIIKICRAYTTTQEDFEDFYQEVCLQIWKSHQSFKEQSKMSTWVYRLSLNVCLTLHQKTKKKKDQQTTNRIPDIQSIENHAFKNESLNLLFDAIRHLSEIDRAIILLYLEEHSYQEISDIIGSNSNNIGVRITRIKTRLQHLLNEMEAV